MIRPATVRRLLIALLIVVAANLLALTAVAVWLPAATLTRLSDLGQAYGALSAVLSALALAAVAMSVHLQSRQREAEARATRRAAHAEMIKMVMAEPGLFAPCIGTFRDHMSVEEYRQYHFTTLWLNHFRASFDVAELGPAVRSEVFATMFASETARRLWRIRMREFRHTQQAPVAVDSFFAVVHAEYEKALTSGGNDAGAFVREDADPADPVRPMHAGRAYRTGSANLPGSIRELSPDDGNGMSAAHIVVLEPGQVSAALTVAADHGVEVERLDRRGIEPVMTVTLVLTGATAAVAAVLHVLDQRKGGQVVDLRPGAPKAFYRTPDVVYGTVVIVAVDGRVTVEVREPEGAFGRVIAMLPELVAGGGAEQAARAITEAFGPDVNVERTTLDGPEQP